MALNKKEQEYLLSLARRAIAHQFKTGLMLDIKPSEIPSDAVVEKGACFVTLHIGKDLRGCIGTLEAHRPLALDVVGNAISAAFEDPRFQPLRKEELPKIKISISVLSTPKPLPVQNKDDLLKKLVPKKHGLILQKGWARATFLPIVWEQITKKEDFLAKLCMKAGLQPDAWKDTKGLEFQTYEAEEFSE